MEQIESFENLLPILDKISTLTYEEKEYLLEILTIDLEENGNQISQWDQWIRENEDNLMISNLF